MASDGYGNVRSSSDNGEGVDFAGELASLIEMLDDIYGPAIRNAK